MEEAAVPALQDAMALAMNIKTKPEIKPWKVQRLFFALVVLSQKNQAARETAVWFHDISPLVNV